jgi:zinc-binding alcohol dehydrogenase family protein
MRAVGYGASRADDGPSCLIDLELPEPLPGASDLLVQVEAVSINPVDAKVRRRDTPAAGDWRVLGWDCAGTVLALGEAVSGFAVGDPVWYAGALNRPGCNSERHLVDHRLVGHRPSGWSAAEAAALPLTAITAWELLFDRLRLPRHPAASVPQTLLVVGAAGGVGSILVQLARALTPLTVVGTASRDSSRRWLEQLGVEHVLNHHQPLAPQLAALDLPPVRAAISLTHSGDHYADLVELLAPQGSLALIDDPDPRAIDVLALKRKSLSLHWELMFTRSLFQTPDMAEQGQILERVAELAQAGRLRTTLQGCVGPIDAEHLRQAHSWIETGAAMGKWVLEGWP